MQRPAQKNRIQNGRFYSFLLSVAASGLLCACASAEAAPDSHDSMKDSDTAALVAPGSIDVVRPLQLAERGRVPEKEPGFLSAEVEEGRLVLAHDGRLPALRAGDVLAGTAGDGYLVKVAAIVSEEAGRIEVETAPATLTELLRDGAIRVRYDSADHARRIEAAVTAARAQGDEGGVGGEEIGSSAQALKVGGATFVDLIKLSGASLPASCGIGAKGDADIDVSAVLMPNIDLDLEIGAKGNGNPAPEIKKFRLVASGMLQVDATLHATGTVTGSCEVDLLKLAGGVPGLSLPPLTFWVGPVPVVVTTEVVPVATAQVALSFQAAEVTAGAHALAGLAAGVEYTEKKWGTVWEPWGVAHGTAEVKAPGDITATCEVSAGAELRARLYGVLGPTLGVEAYARATAETEPPYCAYEGWIEGGVRAYAKAEVGISVGPLDLTLLSLPLLDYELVHLDGPEFSGELSDAPRCHQEP
jgi:hypothetical protein